MALTRGYAVLVSLAVPGLAHLLLGRPLRALVAIATTAGLFWLGWSMLHERLFYVQAISGDLLRHVPVLLLPEFANFAHTMLAAPAPAVDDVDRLISLPREGEHVAFLLTGVSGILSVLWACDAWWVASGRNALRCHPPTAAAISWLLPGAGHVLAGQRSKGLLLGAAVLLMFAGGLALGHGHSVDRPVFSLWWSAQSFCGIGVVFSSLVTAPTVMTSYPEMLDLGVIMCTMAGLMNMMVMTDAFAVAERGATVPQGSPGEVPA